MIRERIKQLIDLLQISNTEFAENVGVQASSISHLVSGRNKPSIDFVQKLHNRYPEVDTNWLLFGEGEAMSSDSQHKTSPTPTVVQESEDPTPYTPKSAEKSSSKMSHLEALSMQSTDQVTGENPVAHSHRLEKGIKNIIIFYHEGTFESFEPKIDS